MLSKTKIVFEVFLSIVSLLDPTSKRTFMQTSKETYNKVNYYVICWSFDHDAFSFPIFQQFRWPCKAIFPLQSPHAVGMMRDHPNFTVIISAPWIGYFQNTKEAHAAGHRCKQMTALMLVDLCKIVDNGKTHELVFDRVDMLSASMIISHRSPTETSTNSVYQVS